MLVPPNLFYLPVSLKSLLFTGVFSRALCTVVLLGCAVHRPELQGHTVWALPALAAGAGGLSDRCALSPSLQHSRPAFVLSPSSRAPAGKAVSVEMLRDAFWSSPHRHSRIVPPALPCPLCWKYPSAWTPSHMESCAPCTFFVFLIYSSADSRGAGGAERSVEVMPSRLCGSAGRWVTYHLCTGLGGCVGTSLPCQCNAGKDFHRKFS